MPSKTQKIISSVILGLLALFYSFSGVVVLLTLQNLWGVVFLIAALVAVGAIIGINNKNKFLLWLGIILSLIQVVDGISALTNKFIFNGDVSIGGPVLIALLYILPIVVMYRIIKNKDRSVGK
jgi:hypothetical protein